MPRRGRDRPALGPGHAVGGLSCGRWPGGAAVPSRAAWYDGGGAALTPRRQKEAPPPSGRPGPPQARSPTESPPPILMGFLKDIDKNETGGVQMEAHPKNGGSPKTAVRCEPCFRGRGR